MANSLLRIGLRSSVFSFERNAAVTVPAVGITNITNKRMLHTKADACNGDFCVINLQHIAKEQRPAERQGGRCSSDIVSKQVNVFVKRSYSKHHGRAEKERRNTQSDSDSDSDSDTECKGVSERSDFWRRKMRTLHGLFDVNKDGVISYDDFMLFAQRFVELGHLDKAHADEFRSVVRETWEKQWGEISPYNLVTVEQYLEDMHHTLNDKQLKRKSHTILPFLFKAVDKDKSGFISVNEFKIFFNCLGLNDEQAAISFAIIDTNADGKLSHKEFVKLGKEFFFTEDERRPSRIFWGPLVDH